MHSYPDKFETLPFSEQFLLWAVRRWVKAQRADQDTVSILREPFERVGAPHAHYALDGFMTIVSMCSEAQITIQCTCRKNVNADENHLLNILSAIQVGPESVQAVNLLRAWLPEAAMRWALDQGQKLAEEMLQAGHTVRPQILGPASRVQPHMKPSQADIPHYVN